MRRSRHREASEQAFSVAPISLQATRELRTCTRLPRALLERGESRAELPTPITGEYNASNLRARSSKAMGRLEGRGVGEEVGRASLPTNVSLWHNLLVPYFRFVHH